MSSRVTQGKLPCPNCPSSDAYHEYDDGHGYCYSCNYTFQPNQLKDFEDLQFTYEYLPWRNVTKDTMRFYDVKTKVSPDGEPIELGFKFPTGEYKVRSLKDKDFRTIGGDTIGKAGLFGVDKFAGGSHKYVTITEGELDALSLWQVLHSPVVSVQSASSAVRDCTVSRDWLASFDRVYLAFDADAPGHDAARAVARLFDYNKLYQVKFSNRKDANEYLVNNEGEELKNIWYNSRLYLPETIVSSFSDFKNILEEEHQEGIPYPFSTVTEMTYGIRTGESVLITAQEGVGKTEVMHAIEHQILKETDDNVGAIFLEEPKRRHLQALAGIELAQPVHLPDSGYSDDEVLSALREVVGKDDRLHVYSHFGSDDPDILLDTIRFLVTARNCRYILLDHISMVVSGRSEDDERRALDRLSTKLEMMVKELNFALIIVSHVNDSGQTRSSRWISKVADVRIHLTRDMDAGSNVVNFMIKDKNRLVGRTGPAGSYAFDQHTRKYTLVTADNDNAQSNGPGFLAA